MLGAHRQVDFAAPIRQAFAHGGNRQGPASTEVTFGSLTHELQELRVVAVRLEERHEWRHEVARRETDARAEHRRDRSQAHVVVVVDELVVVRTRTLHRADTTELLLEIVLAQGHDECEINQARGVDPVLVGCPGTGQSVEDRTRTIDVLVAVVRVAALVLLDGFEGVWRFAIDRIAGCKGVIEPLAKVIDASIVAIDPNIDEATVGVQATHVESRVAQKTVGQVVVGWRKPSAGGRLPTVPGPASQLELVKAGSGLQRALPVPVEHGVVQVRRPELAVEEQAEVGLLEVDARLAELLHTRCDCEPGSARLDLDHLDCASPGLGVDRIAKIVGVHHDCWQRAQPVAGKTLVERLGEQIGPTALLGGQPTLSESLGPQGDDPGRARSDDNLAGVERRGRRRGRAIERVANLSARRRCQSLDNGTGVEAAANRGLRRWCSNSDSGDILGVGRRPRHEPRRAVRKDPPRDVLLLRGVGRGEFGDDGIGTVDQCQVFALAAQLEIRVQCRNGTVLATGPNQ